MVNSEYFQTLKQYVATLKSKINTKAKYDKIDYKQRVSIVKDLQGLVAKNFEEKDHDRETENMLVDHVIPYVSKMIMWEDNPVNVPKQMEVLKDMYRMAARLSLKHFILFYEWDWSKKTKFLEPRQDVLTGYCHYLQELVLNPNFLNVLAELPSGMRKVKAIKIRRGMVFWHR